MEIDYPLYQPLFKPHIAPEGVPTGNLHFNTSAMKPQKIHVKYEKRKYLGVYFTCCTDSDDPTNIAEQVTCIVKYTKTIYSSHEVIHN
jgi:hypothetical protein